MYVDNTHTTVVAGDGGARKTLLFGFGVGCGCIVCSIVIGLIVLGIIIWLITEFVSGLF